METFSALLVIWAGNSPVNSPYKGRWRGALMFSLICVWINDWINNREAGDLRRYDAHYNVMQWYLILFPHNMPDAHCWNVIVVMIYSYIYAYLVFGNMMEIVFNMLTSWNGDIFRVTGHLCREFTGPIEFPVQRPVTRSFDVIFDLRPNKRLC